MKDEITGNFQDKTYRSVNFKPSNLKDSACDHCSFELGKCKTQIRVLGRCFIKEGEEVIKNIYYEEIKELVL